MISPPPSLEPCLACKIMSAPNTKYCYFMITGEYLTSISVSRFECPHCLKSQHRSGWSAGSGDMGRAVVINADDPQQQRVEWINGGGADRQQRFEPIEVVSRLGQRSALLVICATRC